MASPCVPSQYSSLSDPPGSSSPYDGLSPMDEVSTGGGSVPQVSSTDSQHPAVSMTLSSSVSQLVLAHFEKQPPDNMRKSNFFNFVISLYDGNRQPVEVHQAVFKDFCDSHTSGQEYRNGLIYTLNVVYSDGTSKEEELYVRLIDSHTKQLVPYEGTCKNPDFRRVLLTHELICSRCLEHRSCGNKNDTPSDPIIIDRFHLKFFVKCNQNCLKNAGNPKDSRRRFQVALYAMKQIDGSPIACSEAMFVHNNSKHGRRPPPFRESVVGDGKPYIISVYPNEGWVTGGTRACIVGMNFYEGIEVVFGTLPASCEVLSPNAIAVKVPQSPRQGEVDITLVFKGSQFCINNPGKFIYLAPSDNSFDHNFARLERLLRNHDDPENIQKDILLRRAADALETFYSLPRAMGQAPGGPMNHISPLYYPRSPAVFTPAFFTPQGFATGRFNPGFQALISPGPGRMHHIATSAVAASAAQPVTGYGGQKIQSDDGNSVEYSHSNPVSRCSSNETIPQQHSMEPGPNPSVFQFPNFTPGDGMVGEIKTEQMQSGPQGIAKPKPISMGPPGVPFYHSAVAMPYIQVGAHGHAHYHPGAFGHHIDGFAADGDGVDHIHGNRNNNNSTHDSGNINLANLAVNPWHFIPKILPPSPGYFMAPTVSPGLPTTPTGLSGSSVFNFCTPPMISPSKPPFRPSKGSKPAPFSLLNSDAPSVSGSGVSTATTATGLNYSQILAALPSPGGGSFVFPPVTPSGLITPIALPDIQGTSEAPAAASSHQQQVSSTTPPDAEEQPPPSKKPRTDDRSPPTQ